MKRTILVVVAALFVVHALQVESSRGATVTGSASLYTNVFSSATTSVSGTGISANIALSNAVSPSLATSRIVGTSPDNVGTMHWNRGAGNATTVGTLISLEHAGAPGPTGFSGPMQAQIRFDGTPIINLAGIRDNQYRYQITTLPFGTGAQEMQAYFPSMPTYNGGTTTYGDINTLMALPDRLDVIPVQTAGWSTDPGHSIGFGNFSNLQNNDGAGSLVYDGTLGAFITTGPTTGRYFDVDLGAVGTDDLFNVSALLLSTRSDHAEDFNILSSQDGVSFSPIGAGVNVTTSSVLGNNELFAINFNNPFSASHLRFEFSSSQTGFAHLLEFVAFQDSALPAVPEPSSLLLLSLGGWGLLVANRRRRTGA